jgi:hypothetical protein
MTHKNATKKKKSLINVNTFALALAAPLFAYSWALMPPPVFAHYLRTTLTAAVVGASAGVEPNPVNTLAQQLKEREASLGEREQLLNQLEERNVAKNASNNTIAFISLGGSLLLFLLVGLNFYLDTKRRRDQRAAPGKFSIDLKRFG